jgi:hypothetical protein
LLHVHLELLCLEDKQQVDELCGGKDEGQCLRPIWRHVMQELLERPVLKASV